MSTELREKLRALYPATSGRSLKQWVTSGRISVNGAFSDIYATGVSVNGKNVHIQGNENGSWLRVGDAWNYNGVYSEAGDVVIGASTGRVRIGPDDSQYLVNSCRMIPYNGTSTVSCPSNWSVYSFADGAGNMFSSPGGVTAMPLPTAGQMLCCKLQQY